MEMNNDILSLDSRYVLNLFIVFLQMFCAKPDNSENVRSNTEVNMNATTEDKNTGKT